MSSSYSIGFSIEKNKTKQNKTKNKRQKTKQKTKQNKKQKQNKKTKQNKNKTQTKNHNVEHKQASGLVVFEITSSIVKFMTFCTIMLHTVYKAIFVWATNAQN